MIRVIYFNVMHRAQNRTHYL